MYWYREWDSNPYRVNTPADFKSAASANSAIPACFYPYRWMKEFGGADRNRTGDKGFANLCLTTWPRRHTGAQGEI